MFIKAAENITGNKIQAIRSDNGKEIINTEIQKLFENNGIKHERTVAYCPEQNGKIEREMRTVVEAARTMLQAKKMGKQFWAEATNAAVYVLNRTGTSTVAGKSPYELWNKREININEFKVFGTEMYAHVPKQKRTKWDPKGKKGIFVGYDENTKGYRIYFQKENKVEIVRDVIFLPEPEQNKE